MSPWIHTFWYSEHSGENATNCDLKLKVKVKKKNFFSTFSEMKLLAFSLPDALALHKWCRNYFRKQPCCTFSCLRISLKFTTLHRGPLGVLMTSVQLGIDSTHSFNGNRESGSTPANQLITPSPVQLLKRKLMSPWRRLPSPPGPAGPSAMMYLSGGELRDSTPALACIFHFDCNSYSHMDQFLTDRLLILQDWTFESVTLCLAA